MLQQELLWLLHDLGHLDKYPMALGNTFISKNNFKHLYCITAPIQIEQTLSNTQIPASASVLQIRDVYWPDQKFSVPDPGFYNHKIDGQ